MLKPAAILLVTLAASPALAAATDWQEVAPGARARLISSDVVRDGKLLVGLELDMPASTNIYWRIPGETGIATALDFTGSGGVTGSEILWPYPEVDRSNGYLDYVYRGPVVLPVALSVDSPTHLQLSVMMGVCDTICVPASATFTLPVTPGTADPANSIRLDQAVALTPIAWDGAAPAVTFDAAGRALQLAGLDPEIDPASIIADIGDPSVLFETPQKSPEAAIWTLPLLAGAKDRNLLGESVNLTFMTALGAYSLTTTIGPAQP